MIHIDILLKLYSYKDDDGIFYVYSPDLDLVGYGKTLQQAHKSFEIVLKEFINYGIKKGTLIKDLEKHGWRLTQNGYRPPRKSRKSIKKMLPEVYSEFQQIYQIPLQ